MILRKVWRYQRDNHEDLKTCFLKCLFENNISKLYTFLLLLIKHNWNKDSSLKDTKGAMQRCESKDRQYNGQKIKDEMIYKPQCIKLKRNMKLTEKWVSWSALEGLAVPTPLVIPVVLLLIINKH